MRLEHEYAYEDILSALRCSRWPLTVVQIIEACGGESGYCEKYRARQKVYKRLLALEKNNKVAKFKVSQMLVYWTVTA